jgi:hypothetical protein
MCREVFAGWANVLHFFEQLRASRCTDHAQKPKCPFYFCPPAQPLVGAVQAGLFFKNKKIQLAAPSRVFGISGTSHFPFL